ncbi:MAG: MarR family winged helix-turn-helix transcriptional regulator [Microthrixaceae bacterium]
MTSRRVLDFDPIEEARRQWVDHDWGEAADGMAIVTSIVRVDQIFQARIDAVLRDLDLTFARYELLVLLDFSSSGALPLGKIGERLQVHPASVTNAVDRLEADDFVRRQPHPDDGRATLATLTTSGRRIARRATRLLNEQVFATTGLDTADLEQLFGLLRKLRHTAGDFT